MDDPRHFVYSAAVFCQLVASLYLTSRASDGVCKISLLLVRFTTIPVLYKITVHHQDKDESATPTSTYSGTDNPSACTCSNVVTSPTFTMLLIFIYYFCTFLCHMSCALISYID